jgi:hypothetical protein
MATEQKHVTAFLIDWVILTTNTEHKKDGIRCSQAMGGQEKNQIDA